MLTILKTIMNTLADFVQVANSKYSYSINPAAGNNSQSGQQNNTKKFTLDPRYLRDQPNLKRCNRQSTDDISVPMNAATLLLFNKTRMVLERGE